MHLTKDNYQHNLERDQSKVVWKASKTSVKKTLGQTQLTCMRIAPNPVLVCQVTEHYSECPRAVYTHIRRPLRGHQAAKGA